MTASLLFELQPKEAMQNFQLSEPQFKRLVTLLRQGNKQLFEKVFLGQFEPAMNYLKKRFNAEHENAYDVVMNTMADFFERLKDGKIKYGNLRYLFTQMCVQNYYRFQKKERSYLDIDQIDLAETTSNKEEIMIAFDRALAQLGNTCKQLLKNYYYKNISYEKISQNLGKSEVAVRKQKQRCQDKLKSLMQAIYHPTNYTK